MLFALLTIALLQIPTGDWTEVENYNVVTSLEFSPVIGDETVTSTYTVTVLEEKLPEDLTGLESFRIELVVESGFTLSGVIKEWRRIEIESPSGLYKHKAVEMDLIIAGWDYWDLEIFTVNVWYKLKEGWQKKI